MRVSDYNMPIKTFPLTDQLEVRIDDDERVRVYVSGEELELCSQVMTNMQIKGKDVLTVNSVDDLTPAFYSQDSYKLSPDTIYFVYCSNLQAWVENNYDTKLLSKNIAFPLLRELVNIGEVDIQFLKKEIMQRFRQGGDELREFLEIEGFLDDYLTREEFWDLFPPEALILQKIEKLLNKKFRFVLNPDTVDGGADLQFSIIPENKYFVLIINTFEVEDHLIEIIKLFKNLTIRYLDLSGNELEIIPPDIAELPLTYLNLSGNLLESIPSELANLSLNHLYLNNNNLKSIPPELTKLSLINLDLSGNPIETSNRSDLKNLNK